MVEIKEEDLRHILKCTGTTIKLVQVGEIPNEEYRHIGCPICEGIGENYDLG